ncbi:MAG: hypothetical protein ABW252_07495 [Polyangiales bacterium]
MAFRSHPLVRARAVHAAILTSLTVTSLAVAQDRGVNDWSTPSDDQCVPACRDGYECRRGECAPICNPGCEPGTLCTDGGACVPVESREAPVRRSERRSPPDQCVPHCRSGYTCLDGACVSLCNPACPRGEVCSEYGECLPDPEQTARGPLRESREEAPPDPFRESIVNLHVDAAGLAQFGLTPTVELGKKFSGYARLRALNTGVASYFLLGRDREDELQWGLGGAVGMHVFTAKDGTMRGFFGGPALEYVFVKTSDTTRDLATYRTHVLVPNADFGYRWAFRGFLLGVGLRLGLAIPLHEDITPRGRAGCRRADSCTEDLGLSFVPGLFVDLGTFFPRR